MSYNRKIFKALGLFCLTAATSLSAAQGSSNADSNMSMEQRVKDLEQAVKMGPMCPHMEGFGVGADFLYWSTNSDIPFAFKNFSTTTSSLVSTTTVRTGNFNLPIFRLPSKWSPAFRIDLGWNTGYDHWDVQVLWTWYRQTNKKTITDSSFRINDVSSIINPLISNFAVTFIEFSRASTKTKLHYDTIDLELGKTYSVYKHLSLRPFISARGAWMTMKANSSLTGPVFNSLVGFVSPEFVTANGKAKMWGVGPRIGLNTNWGDYQGFSILGNFSLAALYGQYKGNATVNTALGSYLVGTITTLFDTMTFTPTDKKHYELTPTAQMVLGLSWATCFGDSNMFRINVAWETNYWWLDPSIPLSLQGLTAGIKFDF